MKILKITYFASNNNMGDSSDSACDYFRDWAQSELEREYPGADVTVDAVDESCMYSSRSNSDDQDISQSIQDFCSRLWDRCDWSNFIHPATAPNNGVGHEGAKMQTFIITEKQNLNSIRAGKPIEAKDLTSAKRAAVREQMFQGTVLTVETETGTLLAYKQTGKWINAE